MEEEIFKVTILCHTGPKKLLLNSKNAGCQMYAVCIQITSLRRKIDRISAKLTVVFYIKKACMGVKTAFLGYFRG